MQNPMRVLVATLGLFYGNNDIRLHHEGDASTEQDSLQSFNIVGGLQADILESDSPSIRVEDIGAPDEVFVHAGNLSRLLDCSLKTARDHLKDLEAAGLVRKHGDIHVDVGNVVLYRPTLDNPQEYLAAVDEFATDSPVSNPDDLKGVMPRDFTHLGDGEWQYKDDSSITIDVTMPAGKSNRQHIRDQLHKHGLKPTSMKNFQYQLRSKSGLT